VEPRRVPVGLKLALKVGGDISNSQNNWRIRRRHISGSEERKRDRGKNEGEKREREKREK
jgi:hypothetical protein